MTGRELKVRFAEVVVLHLVEDPVRRSPVFVTEGEKLDLEPEMAVWAETEAMGKRPIRRKDLKDFGGQAEIGGRIKRRFLFPICIELESGIVDLFLHNLGVVVRGRRRLPYRRSLLSVCFGRVAQKERLQFEQRQP